MTGAVIHDAALALTFAGPEDHETITRRLQQCFSDTMSNYQPPHFEQPVSIGQLTLNLDELDLDRLEESFRENLKWELDRHFSMLQRTQAANGSDAANQASPETSALNPEEDRADRVTEICQGLSLLLASVVRKDHFQPALSKLVEDVDRALAEGNERQAINNVLKSLRRQLTLLAEKAVVLFPELPRSHAPAWERDPFILQGDTSSQQSEIKLSDSIVALKKWLHTGFEGAASTGNQPASAAEKPSDDEVSIAASDEQRLSSCLQLSEEHWPVPVLEQRLTRLLEEKQLSAGVSQGLKRWLQVQEQLPDNLRQRRIQALRRSLNQGQWQKTLVSSPGQQTQNQQPQNLQSCEEVPANALPEGSQAGETISGDSPTKLNKDEYPTGQISEEAMAGRAESVRPAITPDWSRPEILFSQLLTLPDLPLKLAADLQRWCVAGSRPGKGNRRRWLSRLIERLESFNKNDTPVDEDFQQLYQAFQSELSQMDQLLTPQDWQPSINLWQERLAGVSDRLQLAHVLEHVLVLLEQASLEAPELGQWLKPRRKRWRQWLLMLDPVALSWHRSRLPQLQPLQDAFRERLLKVQRQTAQLSVTHYQQQDDLHDEERLLEAASVDSESAGQTENPELLTEESSQLQKIRELLVTFLGDADQPTLTTLWQTLKNQELETILADSQLLTQWLGDTARSHVQHGNVDGVEYSVDQTSSESPASEPDSTGVQDQGLALPHRGMGTSDEVRDTEQVSTRSHALRGNVDNVQYNVDQTSSQSPAMEPGSTNLQDQGLAFPRRSMGTSHEVRDIEQGSTRSHALRGNVDSVPHNVDQASSQSPASESESPSQHTASLEPVLSELRKSLKELDAALSISRQRQTEADYLANDAGLMLLWPHLSRLFTRRQLLDEESQQFIDEHARLRAMALLVKACGLDTDDEEATSVSAALLTGLPPETLIKELPELGTGDSRAVDHLLQTLIGQWQALKDMAPASLQSLFLQRQGFWELVDSGWKITVADQAQDVLLQALPWPVSMVHLPWLEGVISVHWKKGADGLNLFSGQ